MEIILIYKFKKISVKKRSIIVILIPVLLAITGNSLPNINLNDDWQHYGYDYSNSKFSPLDKINLSNVGQLKEVWHFKDAEEGSSVFF